MVLIERRKIDINGRIQIPSAMREEMRLQDGNEVVVFYANKRLEIFPAGSFKLDDYVEAK